MDPSRQSSTFNYQAPRRDDDSDELHHQDLSTAHSASIQAPLRLDPNNPSLELQWDPLALAFFPDANAEPSDWSQIPQFHPELPVSTFATHPEDHVAINMDVQTTLPPIDSFFTPDESLASADPNLFAFEDNSLHWDGLFNTNFLQAMPINYSPVHAYDARQGPEKSDSDEAASTATTLMADEGFGRVMSTGRTTPNPQPGPEFSTEEERWQAVLSRSRAADRCFLYGVVTTKVFCRPSCASRRAGRQHVQFFPFPGAIDAATAAGFRACKRCVPDQLGVADKGVNGVVKALRLIISDAFEPKENRAKIAALKLEDLAKEAELSPFHFQRVFKATTQMTPGDFSTACQSLALQDALAHQLPIFTNISRRRVRSDDTAVFEILQKYSRWSLRTAKKALGGAAPSD